MRSQGFAFGNILRLAAYEQARRALRRECAPDSAQSAERVQFLCRIRQKEKRKETHKVPLFSFWWSRCRHRRTPLLSFIFALKSFFNIVKRDIVDAQRLLARVDDQREMVIVQIDRVYEDVDKRSALVEIVHRHFANEIKKGIYLRLG